MDTTVDDLVAQTLQGLRRHRESTVSLRNDRSRMSLPRSIRLSSEGEESMAPEVSLGVENLMGESESPAGTSTLRYAQPPHLGHRR